MTSSEEELKDAPKESQNPTELGRVYEVRGPSFEKVHIRPLREVIQQRPDLTTAVDCYRCPSLAEALSELSTAADRLLYWFGEERRVSALERARLSSDLAAAQKENERLLRSLSGEEGSLDE